MSILEANGPVTSSRVRTTAAASVPIVAGEAGVYILMLGLVLSNNGGADTTILIEDEDEEPLIGPITLEQSQNIVIPVSGIRWAETGRGKALHLKSSAAVELGGVIVWQRYG